MWSLLSVCGLLITGKWSREEQDPTSLPSQLRIARVAPFAFSPDVMAYKIYPIPRRMLPVVRF